MGKRVKKKSTRNAQKEKQFLPSSTKNVSQKIIPTMVVDGASVVKEARVCPHLDTGINLDKISSKIASLEYAKCDDCSEGVVDRRASKVKGKHGKKKASGSASESKSIWVCLECGHFTCGGVGLPTTPQSHATRHAKHNHHALAVQFANPNLRWCFPCNTLIPVQSSEENGEHKDALSDVIKLLKAPSSSPNSLDVEDVWFGSGSITSKVKSASTLIRSENNGGYMVKGLVNLGNTCFFNSILQNLLAMDKLRDHFLRLEEPVGSLSVSLKKLFVETNPSTSVKNVINPQSLFNSVCAIAPQFKGYQQQDSHELLRFLLDGICNESGVQTSASSSERESTAPKHTPTFVDSVFGGQTSSTVSCLECGHTSIVYEPYLDLSLPLPTKKSSSKKMPSVSRSRKQKPPPKRRGKFVTKTNRASSSSPADSVPIIATTSNSLHTEKKVVPSADSTQPEFVFLQGNVTEKISESTIKESGISSDNLALVNYVEPATVLNGHGNQTVDSSDILSWLDYLEPTAVSSEPNDDMVAELTGKTELVQDEPLLQQTIEASNQVYSLGSEETPPLADDSWLDYLEPSSSSNGHIMASQNEDSSVVQNSGNNNDVFWENEQPLKVQESEIILLPYEELVPTSNGNEVTLSSVNYEQEPSDFDGFSSLFDEPEVDVGPTMGPFLNGFVESGPMARNISDSDSDEVDNTDYQVSVDKCLTYFTTSELLTKTEHAWQCEQCSKSLLEQKTRLKNKLQEPVSNGTNHSITPSILNGIRNPIEVSDVLDNSDENSSLEERGNGVNGVGPELSQHPSLIMESGEDSCVIQDTSRDFKFIGPRSDEILYTTRESDSHSIFMELSCLLIDGNPEFHLANFLHMITTMTESGSTVEQIETFIMNSQKVPKLMDEEPVWSIQPLGPIKTSATTRLTERTVKRNSSYSSNRNWPPASWKTAPKFISSHVNGLEMQQNITNQFNLNAGSIEEHIISTDHVQNVEPSTSSNDKDHDAAAGSYIEPGLVDQDGSCGFSHKDRLSHGAANVQQALLTGRHGEELAFKYYSRKFDKKVVKWMNEGRETGLPYDIKVCDEENRNEYIEVKTTDSRNKDWFEISVREWQFAVEEGESFSIVRVVLLGNKTERVTVFKNPVKLCRNGHLKLAVLMPNSKS